jgi:hypothetical protein
LSFGSDVGAEAINPPGDEWLRTAPNTREFNPLKGVGSDNVIELSPAARAEAVARLDKSPFYEIKRAQVDRLRAKAGNPLLRTGRFFVVRAVSVSDYAPHGVLTHDKEISVDQLVMGSAQYEARKSAVVVRLDFVPTAVFGGYWIAK